VSAAGDKQIRFTFAVDQRSLGEAKNAISSLTSEVKKLVETMARAGSAMHGGFGGGSGLLGGMTANKGGVNTSQQSTIKGGTILTAGIANDAKALTGLAKASTDALSQITRAMRSSFSGQVSEIEKLKRELGSLESQYERIQKVAAEAKPGSPGARRAESLAVSNEIGRRHIQDQINGHMETRAAFDSWDEYQSNPYRSGAPGGKRGFFARVFNQGGGAGGADGNPFQGGLQGMLLRGLGVGGLAAGSILAGGAAGTALIGKLGNVAASSQISNAQYNLDLGMRDGRMGARIGGSVGQLGLGIRGGDLASSIAMEHFATTGAFASRGYAATAGDRIELAMGAAGNKATFGDQIGRAWDYAGRKTFGKDGLKSDVAMKMDNALAEIPAKMAEEMAEQVRNEIASNPAIAAKYNQTYSGAFSNISMARMGGIGLGLNKAGTSTKVADFEAAAIGAGFSGAERAAANASLGGVAGRGLMGNGLQMLQLAAGGFGNAGQIYGVGAQFGGGGSRGAGALLGAVQHQGLGGGGVDVTAGSQLAGLIANAMQGGNFMGANGIAAMQGIMSAGYTGTTGGDMRQSRILQAGLGEYGRNLSGGTDNLQMGINTLAANQSGASGWYAKRALMTMDPTQMMQALRSGNLPQHLADQGLTMDNLKSYNQYRNSMAFSRYIDAEGGNSNVANAVAGVKGAGGVGSYLHQLLGKHGAGSKTGRGIIQRALEQLGTARMATEGGSLEGNEGALEWEIMGDKSLRPALKSRGAGGPSLKGTTEGAVAEQEAKKAREQGEFEAQRYDRLRGSISRMVDNSNAMEGLTKDLVKNTTVFDGALVSLTNSIMNSLQRLAPAEYARLQKQQQELSHAQHTAGAPNTDLKDPGIDIVGVTK
jgi:hypothetical protein